MVADISVALPTSPLTLICKRRSSGQGGALVEHNPLHPDIVARGSVSNQASAAEGKQSVRDRVVEDSGKGAGRSL